MKTYICRHCGNIISMIFDKGVPVICCGTKMEELIPNTVEASTEKHLPVVEVVGNTVKVDVGSVEHPMMEAHFIEWIAVETTRGVYRKQLSPSCKPCADFCLTEGESFIAAYAYCNLHGLWKNSQSKALQIPFQLFIMIP